MSSDLFHVAQVKVNRGRKHLADIAPVFAALTAEHDRHMSTRNLIGIATITGGVSLDSPIPERQLDEIACCVGDAVHNMRASLDLLACEVVERSDGNPRNVHFPFADTKAGLTTKTSKTPSGGALKGKNFHRASQEAQAALLALEPHGEPGGNALLWGLHQLDLIDKHQDLLALSHSLQTPALYIEGIRMEPPDAAPRRLVFAPGDHFAGHEVVAVLESFASEVERVIASFARLFR